MPFTTIEKKTVKREKVVSGEQILSKHDLHANVARTCVCGSPPYWHNIPNSHNPETYAPEKVTDFGRDYVGDKCVRCGRPIVIENHGKIFEETVRTETMAEAVRRRFDVVGAITNLIRGRKSS